MHLESDRGGIALLPLLPPRIALWPESVRRHLELHIEPLRLRHRPGEGHCLQGGDGGRGHAWSGVLGDGRWMQSRDQMQAPNNWRLPRMRQITRETPQMSKQTYTLDFRGIHMEAMTALHTHKAELYLFIMVLHEWHQVAVYERYLLVLGGGHGMENVNEGLPSVQRRCS